MADEPTAGELYRSMRDHVQRSDVKHAALDERISRLEASTVPLGEYRADQRARDREVQTLERRMEGLEHRHEALEQRPAMTVGRWAAVILAVAAVLTLVVTAYGTLKGAH